MTVSLGEPAGCPARPPPPHLHAGCVSLTATTGARHEGPGVPVSGPEETHHDPPRSSSHAAREESPNPIRGLTEAHDPVVPEQKPTSSAPAQTLTPLRIRPRSHSHFPGKVRPAVCHRPVVGRITEATPGCGRSSRPIICTRRKTRLIK